MEVCQNIVSESWHKMKTVDSAALDLSHVDESSSSSSPSSVSEMSLSSSTSIQFSMTSSPVSPCNSSLQGHYDNHLSPDTTQQSSIASTSSTELIPLSASTASPYNLSANSSSQSMKDEGANAANVPRMTRKHVGMRYLFPPLPDSMNLLEKTKIWVERHSQGYYVGWTEEQLAEVDKLVRPLKPMTERMYKEHMNRSEHCRNIKLKYCLESNESWAVEYRERLCKPYTMGGFSGLCQAKICAADLWREHSENYKSHQARYPPSKRRRSASPQSTPVPSQLSSLLQVQQPTINPLVDHHRVPHHPLADSSIHVCASPDDCHHQISSSDDTVILLFPTFYNTNYSLKDKIDITLERLSNNYFVDWTAQKLKLVDSYLRPLEPISRDLWKQEIMKRTLKFDLSLRIIMTCNEEWTLSFKNRLTSMLSNNPMKSLCEAKSEALRLCNFHIPRYLKDQFSQYTYSILPQTFVKNEAVEHKRQCVGELGERHSRTTLQSMLAEASNKYHSSQSESDMKYTFYIAFHDKLGHLFEPLPSNLTVLEQLNVWLERHRANFYLNYSESMLMDVDILCRPKVIVNQELYQKYVPSIAIKTLAKITTLFNCRSSNSAAEAFMNDIRIGCYYDIIQVMTKTEECWSTMQNTPPSSPSIAEHPKLAPIIITHPPVPIEEQILTKCQSVPVQESVDVSPEPQTFVKTPTEVLDLSKKSPNSLIQKLWSLRDILQESLQLDATQSWHDKLQTHLPLLRKHLGSNYKLPTTVAECMADMTLITLHAEVQNYQF